MMAKNNYYVTTPIYYVNGKPHIGHSYTTIAADCLARHRRSRGDEVFFLTGTDEHGQKVLKVAQEKGLAAQEYVDSIIPSFKSMWERLRISYDDFIRTTQDRHIQAVGHFFNKLLEKKDLYVGEYEGLYCVPCEVFWTPKQVIDGVCSDCKRPVETIRESNYFFAASKYQGWLLEHIESHPDFIKPESRRNEILSFLRENQLEDLCVSRPRSRLSWGISLPFSPDHVAYVWFDALINYVSALGYPQETDRFAKFWPHAIHLIGKDILRQHSVLWPIMLKAAGLPVPKTIFAHGWWQVGVDKMSKSLGNAVDPLALIDEFGIDVYRYFLMREVPFGLDGIFSRDALVKRFNGDLANDLGNLVYRTLTMAEKYFDGRIPAIKKSGLDDFSNSQILPRMNSLSNLIDTALDKFDFILALEGIWSLIGSCNKYIEETKPWNLKKEGRLDELENFIAVLIQAIRVVGIEIAPFMPGTSEKILAQISLDRVNKTEPLFPRIEVEKPVN